MAVQLDARPPVRPAHRTAQPSRLIRLSRFDTKYSPYLYIAPFFLLFGVFGSIP